MGIPTRSGLVNSDFVLNTFGPSPESKGGHRLVGIEAAAQHSESRIEICQCVSCGGMALRMREKGWYVGVDEWFAEGVGGRRVMSNMKEYRNMKEFTKKYENEQS